MRTKAIHLVERVVSSYYKKKCPRMEGDLKKIALICTQPLGLGDLAMSTPFIRSIRDAYPQAKIDLLTDRMVCDGFSGVNVIKLSGNFYEMLLQCRKIKEKYDLVVVMNRAINQVFYAWALQYKYIMGYLGGFSVSANFKIKKTSFSKQGHFSLMALHNATALGIPLKKELLEPEFSSATEKKARKMFDSLRVHKKLICIAPFGIWETRQWYKEGYIGLIKKLSDYEVVLYGGPDAKRSCGEIEKKLKKDGIIVHNVCGKMNLSVSTCFLQYVDLMICGDGGPMHFSFLMRRPTLSLFGPVKPEQRLPMVADKKFRALWYGDFASVSEYDYESKHEDPSMSGLKAIPVNKVYKEALILLKNG